LHCVDFVIINKQLKTADFSFSWLSLHKQWCYTNTQTHNYNSQSKAKVRRSWTKSPNKANTDHHSGDL